MDGEKQPESVKVGENCSYPLCSAPKGTHPSGCCEEHAKQIDFLVFALDRIGIQGYSVLAICKGIIDASLQAQYQEMQRKYIQQKSNGGGLILRG